MITLTTQIPVKTVLGAAGNTNYDRLNILTLLYDVVNKSISGQCQLMVSTNSAATPIIGSYNIPTSGQAILTISIPNLPYFGSVALTSPQQAIVQGWVQSAQNTLEAGFVSVGVISGVQATGF